MAFEVEDKVVEAAAQAPMKFVTASQGEGQEYSREPGIQLTKEQIISLRKYEVLGLSLPTRYNDVVSYLNYGVGDIGGAGLTATDFLRTFTLTYNHARRWSPLREQIMLTGSALTIFAAKILRVGGNIVGVYDGLDVSDYLKKHNITSVEEYKKLKIKMPDIPGIELAPDAIEDIAYYLNDILVDVKKSHADAAKVKSELDSFGTDMREKVLPEIKLRLKSVSDNTYKQDIQVLQDEIDQRAAAIDELNKQYDQLVQEAIKAAATLNIGGLILGIYQGVKAEQVRSQRKTLKAEQDLAIQKMASKNQTLSSLNRVRGDLQNLSYVAIEAEVATQNLMLVWNALSLYLDESLKEVTALENAVKLMRFINHIKGVIEPWGYIQASSDALLKVFEEAEKEYEANNLILGSRTKMVTMLNAVAYPELDLLAMRNFGEGVQDASTQAQVLSQQYDYLPGVVSTMSKLALSLNESRFDLRGLAQESIFNVDKAAKDLKEELRYLEESENEEEEEETRDYMEAALLKAFSYFSGRVKDLKSVHSSFATGYSRAASAQWVDELEQDQLSAEKRKVNTLAKIVELDAQMKSVSEAIDLIAKNGIDKIGQEAQLTLDNLKALGMAPPQIQIAMLAMDTLKKLISGIGEAISFLSMTAGYNRLRDKAIELRATLATSNHEISQIKGKVLLVKTLDELDDRRLGYANEFVNVIAAFEQLTRDFTQDKSRPVEERANTALAQIPGIINYLNPLQQ